MSVRRVDLGTAVRAWRNRSGEMIDGVVTEIVPPQKFPRTKRVTHTLDFQPRYVIENAGHTVIRSLDQMEIVAL
jgi:hypothetical protein